MTTISPSPVDFVARSMKRVRELRSVLCVGLDPQIELMPIHLVRELLGPQRSDDWAAIGRLIIAFNLAVIDAVAEFTVWVKPNIAFYECYGSAGLYAYEVTIAYARSKGLLVICDGKRGDGDRTAEAYAGAHLGTVPVWDTTSQTFTTMPGPLHVDALTIETTIADAGVDAYIHAAIAAGTAPIIVIKTSFKPNSAIEQIRTEGGGRVWEELAKMVDRWGNDARVRVQETTHTWNPVWAVVGATFPNEARIARELMPRTWFLVPGYGAQGGGADDAITAANSHGFGVAVNSSRGVIFAQQKGPFAGPSEQFAASVGRAAEAARDELNEALKRANKGRGTFWG